MTLSNRDLARIFEKHSCARAGCEVDETGVMPVIVHKIEDFTVRVSPKVTSPEEARAILSERLRAAREAKGWTQSELATRAGVSNQTIVRIENGYEKWGVETALRVGSVLGVPPETLLEGITWG